MWLRIVGGSVAAALIVLIVVALAVPGALPFGPKARAHEAIKKGLFDPTSPLFSEEVIGDNEMVCGFVNAKNRMGAYVGATPYLYVTDNVASTLPSTPKEALRKFLHSDLNDADWKENLQNVYNECAFVDLWKSGCVSHGSNPLNDEGVCQAVADSKTLRDAADKLGIR